MAENEQVSVEPAQAKPKQKPAPKPRQLPSFHVVLLDDDEHTFDYVIDMLQSLFGHSEQRSREMAKQVDATGRSIVCTTHRERAELKRDQILGYGSDFRIARCRGSMRAVVEAAEGAE